MNTFEITYNGKPVQIISSTFNGGEEHVRLSLLDYVHTGTYTRPYGHLVVEAHVTSSQQLIQLAMIKDAAERLLHPETSCLHIPYFPYARQDRVCNTGEAFSLEVVANMINSMEWDSVVVVDPHSDVTPALINNVIVMEQWESFKVLGGLKGGRDILIIPDAGAAKKSLKVAKYLGWNNIVQATKVRDIETGSITNTVVHASDEELDGAYCTIFDDICDAGGTFIALAKKLKEKGVAKVTLCITHAILPNGADHLYENGIDEIWTTDSIYGYTDYPVDERINVIKLSY